nr:MAG TPA: hypothetical protein [Caudoviricetes sp.]
MKDSQIQLLILVIIGIAYLIFGIEAIVVSGIILVLVQIIAWIIDAFM